MSDVLNALAQRRSIRAYQQDKPIDRASLEAIVNAGRCAPSAMNRQTRHFTVVQNREALAALTDAMRKALNNDSYNFYCPDALILLSDLRTNRLACDDCACALENIFLAAYDLGIGSVWINQVRDVCDQPCVRTLLTKFGVPEDHVVFGTAALGYPAESGRSITPRENAVSYVL